MANARLADLTDHLAIERAVREFKEVGRDEFLRRHEFGPSDSYFVVIDGRWVDSKALLGAAYAIQHPDRERLTSKDFSGGQKRIGPICERLGLVLTTVAQSSPPQLGDSFPTRQALKDHFGGELTRGIVPFPGDDTINIFSSEGGPYIDETPSLYSTFSYRGEGLEGNQDLSARGNARLENCRLNRTAARFWFQPIGEEITFISWVMVQSRAWVQGTDKHGESRWEIKWFLHPVSSSQEASWPDSVNREFSEQPDVAVTPPAVDASSIETISPEQLFQELTAGLEKAPPKTSFRTVKQYARSEYARQATLWRAQDRCENPECGGMPIDRTPSGSAILEVDHIKELSAGGDDHPSNMIALCPNCHAMKTRGSRSRYWQKVFNDYVRQSS